MSFDKAKLIADQEALLKKVGKDLALAELSLLVPELAELLVSALPVAAQPLVQGLEASFLPQIEDAVQKLIVAKLG